jgi:hypothetical protein
MLAVLPILLTAALAVAASGDRLYPSADHAVLELETLGAGRHVELLGTYSRYHWHHPGPAVFYLILPVYQLLGQSTAGMHAGAALINLAAAATAIAAAARFGGARLGLWAGIVIGLFLASIQVDLLRDLWMPHIVILSVVALAFLSSGLALGRAWCLPAVAAVATFLCESNLSVAPAVISISVAGFAMFLVSRRMGWAQPAKPARPAWPPYALAVAITVVLVAPPVYQELSRDRGNLTQLWTFFRTPDSGHSLMEGVRSVATAFSVLPGGSGVFDNGVLAYGRSTGLLLTGVALLVTGAGLAIWRRRAFAAALCTIALAGLAGAVIGVTNIRGPIHPYLVFCVSGLAPVAWVGIAAAWGPELLGIVQRRTSLRIAPWIKPALVVALAGMTAVNLWAVARGPSVKTVETFDDPNVKTITAAATRYMDARRVRKFLVVIPYTDRWAEAAGVVLQLAREGRPVSVEPSWLFMFGEEFATRSKEDGVLAFTANADPPTRESLGPLRPLVTAGGTTVYALSDR